MFENIKNIFKKNKKKETAKTNSKDAAKERLHLVLMQDRANVSADFLDLMRREIIEVIKKYIDIDEEAMDVRLTTETNEEGVQGVPALYANIPIVSIKDEAKKLNNTSKKDIKIEPPNLKEAKIEEKSIQTESNQSKETDKVNIENKEKTTEVKIEKEDTKDNEANSQMKNNETNKKNDSETKEVNNTDESTTKTEEKENPPKV